MDRIVHVITSECDVYISTEGDLVRAKITEKDPNIVNPTSFEVEGDPKHIAEAFATVAAVLENIEATNAKTPS